MGVLSWSLRGNLNWWLTLGISLYPWSCCRRLQSCRIFRSQAFPWLEWFRLPHQLLNWDHERRWKGNEVHRRYDGEIQSKARFTHQCLWWQQLKETHRTPRNLKFQQILLRCCKSCSINPHSNINSKCKRQGLHRRQKTCLKHRPIPCLLTCRRYRHSWCKWSCSNACPPRRLVKLEKEE